MHTIATTASATAETPPLTELPSCRESDSGPHRHGIFTTASLVSGFADRAAELIATRAKGSGPR